MWTSKTKWIGLIGGIYWMEFNVNFHRCPGTLWSQTSADKVWPDVRDIESIQMLYVMCFNCCPFAPCTVRLSHFCKEKTSLVRGKEIEIVHRLFLVRVSYCMGTCRLKQKQKQTKVFINLLRGFVDSCSGSYSK